MCDDGLQTHAFKTLQFTTLSIININNNATTNKITNIRVSIRSLYSEHFLIIYNNII
jgi:hypothetical protein